MENEQPSYFAIIPANVRYDPDLTASEKLLYGEITCLCSKHGKCWAQNSYFANLYGVSKSTVSRWICDLKKKGFIEVEIEYADSGEILNRYLYLGGVGGIRKNEDTPIRKNEDRGIRKKRKDNNTSRNNTSLSTEQSLTTQDQALEPADANTPVDTHAQSDHQVAYQSEHRANDEIRVSFEKLMSASIKPVADNRRNQTYQAYCQRLKDGYSARQIAQEYETYKRYYTLNNATDRYAKQLERWLTDEDGLKQALPAAKRQEQKRRCAHKLAQAEREKREADEWQARSNDLAKTDPVFAAKREKWKNLQKAAIFAAEDRRKSLHDEIQTLLSEMNEYLRIHSTSGLMAALSASV